MAQGGGQAGGMGASPMGGMGASPMGGQPMPNIGGMVNSTNSTTTQDMMGRGGNGMPFAQNMRQFGFPSMGGQQGDYGGGYNPMFQQGMGQIPEFASPYFQQMQQMRQQQMQQTQPTPQQIQEQMRQYQPMPQQMPQQYQPQQMPQQYQPQQMPQQQMMRPDPMANPMGRLTPSQTTLSPAQAQARPISEMPQPQPQPRLNKAQRRKVNKLASSAPAPIATQTQADFSKMGKAGQFGDQGFAQGLQDYASQQYKDYAYNPANQTFYKGGDKAGATLGLADVLRGGRAAGYKMASGGIAALRR